MQLLKKLLVTIFIFIIILLLLLVFLRNPALDYVAQKYLIPELSKNGLEISIENPTIEFISLNALNLEVIKQVKFLRVPLKISNFEFQPNLLTLFSKIKKFKIYSDIYRGKVKLFADFLDGEESLNVNGAIENLKVEEYELFKNFGIRNGLLNLEIDELRTKKNNLNLAKFSFDIKDLELLNKVLIPTSLTRFPFPIEIPPLVVTSLTFNSKIIDENFEINDIKLLSSILSAKGFINSFKGNLDIDLELSELGNEKYGTILQAFSNSSLNTNKYNLSSTLGFRNLKITAKM